MPKKYIIGMATIGTIRKPTYVAYAHHAIASIQEGDIDTDWRADNNH